MAHPDKKNVSQEEEFARLRTVKRASFWSDYFFFLRTTRKWWMLPLILLMLWLSVLMIVMSSGAFAPFIYTLF